MPDESINILVVDDTPLNLLAMESILEDLGQKIVRAKSGQEALRLSTTHDFALIFLDVHMPIMDGFETARQLRQSRSCQSTPIIFVTAMTPAESQQIYRGYSLGAVDYIFSPLVAEVVRAKAAVFIDLFRKTRELAAKSERLVMSEGKKVEELKEKLQRETERSRFYQLSSELLGVSDSDRTLKHANPAWARLMGYTEEALRNKKIVDLIDPADRKTFQAQLERLEKKPDRAFLETRCLCQDGTKRWIAWTVVASPTDHLLYWFGRDMTEFKDASKWKP